MAKKKEKKTKKSFSELKKKIEELEKEREEYLVGWQRTKADFLNFKSKEAERIKDVITFANQELILEILPILDNLDLAEKNLSNKDKDNEYIKGVLQIKKQIKNILRDQGVEKIETEKKEFDPNFHQVVEQVEKKNTSPNMIIEEVKKGYTLNSKVLRPAEVKISK